MMTQQGTETMQPLQTASCCRTKQSRFILRGSEDGSYFQDEQAFFPLQPTCYSFETEKRIQQVNVLDGFVHMLQLHLPWKSQFNVRLWE